MIRSADANLPFDGRWTVEVIPVGGASRVEVTEDGVIKNPIFRFLSRTVFSLTATQEKYLCALGRHLATEVTPRPGEPAP